MRPEITKEKKQRLAQELKRLRILPLRGELIISVGPDGSIGNIKVITNH
jgi:hypothetical protein